MTRDQANRILDAVRDGRASPSDALITRALVETGDIGLCDVVTSFVEEWVELRRPAEEIAT
jgi:hypothetical protein